jgi:hypothetical protein
MFHDGCNKRTVSRKKLKLHGPILVVYNIGLVHDSPYSWFVLLQNNLSSPRN